MTQGKALDPFVRAQMSRTAESLKKLAALRGLSGVLIDVSDDGHYVANGTDCGPSVHGVYAWFDDQPWVQP